MTRGALIERDAERRRLEAAVAGALAGHGSLILLSGEAGVGKTRFAEEVLGGADAHFLRGTAGPGGARRTARSSPRCAGSCAPCPAGSRAAVRCAPISRCCCRSSATRWRRATAPRCSRRSAAALAAIAAERPAVVLLDDLQWSDDATLELLATLAGSLRESADARGRRLPLRRDPARASAPAAPQRPAPRPPARRAGARAARRRRHGRARRPRARRRAVRRGSPARCTTAPAASRSSSRSSPRRSSPAAACAGDAGVELALDADVPLPQTIRDAVLLRAGDLSDQARATAEAASVAGTRFDLELVAALGCEAGLEELLAARPDRGARAGPAAFRHPLARDAIYEDVPWLRRRSLHRRLAAALEARGSGHAEVAGALARGARRIPRARLARAGDRRAGRGARLPRRGAARAPGARPVARGRARRRADRGARAARALRGAGGRARRGGPRAARGGGGAPRGGRRPRPRRRRAPARGDLRAPGRPRARAGRAARRGGRLRRERPPRRGRHRAADRRRLPAERRPPRRGRRARAPRRRGGRARGADRPAGADPRARRASRA